VRNPTNYKIALAHLTSRGKQTLVAVLSVTFGISMYVFMNSFMSGVNNAQTDLAFSTLAHIRIYNDLPEDNTNLMANLEDSNTVIHLRNPKVMQYTDGIKNSEAIIHSISTDEGITGIAPQLNINVFFRNGATELNGLLSGIDVQYENDLFGTAQYIIEGSWDNLKTRNDGIIMGAGLAQRLSLKLNDNATVITADNVSRNYKIVGIFKTTLGSVDNGKAFIKIGTARQLLSKNMGFVSDIQINVADYNKAPEIAQRLSAKTDYKVEPWQEANGQLEAANGLRDIIAISVSLTILMVAGFGIYNIMNMTVNEKIREIAILKAIGFDGGDIVQIFLTQSIIIGIIGDLAGLFLGYVVSNLIHLIPFKIANLETLPIAFDVWDFIMAFLFGLITTFIAGYLPARKASKLDPVEIIRS
tara:strand:+ start:59137 stop:60381 length:1245 start_codon:yes stop_codon:yes gene_type:complete